MLATSSNIPPHGLIGYSGIWLIIGLMLLVVIVAWYIIAIFWLSRRKPVKSIADLEPLPLELDLNGLKMKYIQLIDQCYMNFQQGKINSRTLHYELSGVVRYFVYEANHFPAPNLTLADIRRAPFPNLTNLIGAYYVSEFAAMEKGDPQASVRVAKEVVQRWV